MEGNKRYCYKVYRLNLVTKSKTLIMTVYDDAKKASNIVNKKNKCGCESPNVVYYMVPKEY